MNLSPLLTLFSQIAAYNDLADALHTGELTAPMQRPLGVLTAARPALLAALQVDVARPILLITARPDRARLLAEQLKIWANAPSTIYHLPEPGPLPYERVVWSNETKRERLATLAALVNYRNSNQERQNSILTGENKIFALLKDLPPLVVTSAPALMQSLLPPAKFTMQHLRLHQQVKLNDLVKQWLDWGYRLETMVEVPGTFSRRGGILDIFPVNARHPIRIDLFGNDIDSLRTFDPASQRSLESLESVTISPATEALPSDAPPAAHLLKQLDLSTLQHSTRNTILYDIAQLENGTHFRGIEYYLPFFYNNVGQASCLSKLDRQDACPTATIFDYLPSNLLVFIEGMGELALAVEEWESQARTMRQNMVNVGDLPADWPLPYQGWQKLSASLLDHHPLILGRQTTAPALATDLPAVTDPLRMANPQRATDRQDACPTEFFRNVFLPAPTFGGQVKKFLPEIITRKKQGERVILLSRQSARLSSLLEEQHITAVPSETLSPDAPPPSSSSITLIHGVLMEGWLLNGQSVELTILTDSEIFGWKKPTTLSHRQPRKGVTPETFFADVSPGDYVVHIEHGIGRYIGLVKLQLDGVEREYLAVEYANNDKLYVPIHQADRLARYVGVDEHQPTMTRLGGADWHTVKRRAKKAIEDLAKDLLEIYAKREVVNGRAFSPDTEWQIELEDAFPFVETDDQLRAINEVKQDMEKDKPMDRLVCGDVGFGKTEVALRAAFKAVMDGLQVAVLVPTTVLAQQHYQTFCERLRKYPIKIEMMSRFRTHSQQQQTLVNLTNGAADIVIGTHRLVQDDVTFKDLGLLIIDEEQRFGVKHKERLKTMRTEVDVLTLTATPIPRTLHMSLSGIRNLSIIETPPEARLPIHTVVTEYDETQIRQAILREVERGGQVFYVFNRVMGIEQRANHLQNIIPEARFVVGHGQMSERKLERVMVEFVAGEHDVLVSTTIIESGLDMPNVNTIIIERADCMGLAQLYQLRGRVGRGAIQAYAYLLTPKHHEVSPDAYKRLEAIAEANELGAGFRIAMRDLEMRGAGELLGSKQHGQIAAIGFDLYTRLLTQAIRELTGGQTGAVLKTAPVSNGAGQEESMAYLSPLAEGIQLDLPLPSYVPESYLPEERLRLRLYRRLAGLTKLSEIEDMAKELTDRFGKMPEPVVNLLYQLKLKVLARQAQVKSIVTEAGQLVLRSNCLELLDRRALQRRLPSASKITHRQLWLPLHPNPAVWQAELEKALRLIGRMVGELPTG